jgi:hypothetical protein
MKKLLKLERRSLLWKLFVKQKNFRDHVLQRLLADNCFVLEHPLALITELHAAQSQRRI